MRYGIQEIHEDHTGDMFFFSYIYSIFSGAVMDLRLYSYYSHLSSFCNLITLSEKIQSE